MAHAPVTAKLRTLGERARSQLFQHRLLYSRRDGASDDLILFYNSMFGGRQPLPESPPGRFEFTDDLRRFPEANRRRLPHPLPRPDRAG